MKLNKNKNKDIIYGVEKYLIKPNNPYFKEIDKMAFKAKNLYNFVNYYKRQIFFIRNKIKNNNELNEQDKNIIDFIHNLVNEYNQKNKNKTKKTKDKSTNKYIIKPIKLLDFNVYNFDQAFTTTVADKIFKKTPDYSCLYSSISKRIIIDLFNEWESYYKAMEEYKKDPSKFSGRPKLPKYKDKSKGRYPFKLSKAANCKVVNGYIIFPNKNFIPNFKLKTKLSDFVEVRFIPKNGCYIIEVVYEKKVNNLNFDKNRICSIDIGVNNLATIVNNINLKPIAINGKPLKSINQYYNKKRSKLMSYIGDKGNSNRLDKLHLKRNNKVEDYLHKASKYIINYCLNNNIGTIVIGKNKEWKQNINLGKTNNQNFVCIPHSKFIEKIKYKAHAKGIDVIIQEESYTSKASFLDNDEIPIYKNKENKNDDNNKNNNTEKETYVFSGIRKSRGMYISANGTKINADVNGAYNIMKKAIPNALQSCNNIKLHPKVVNII